MRREDLFVTPELDYPFAPAVSEHIEVLDGEISDWARSMGLLSTERAYRLFGAAGLGRLVARTHPDSSLEDLRLISGWYAWLFLQDDVRDDSGVGRRPGELSALDERFIEVLEGGADLGAGEDPLVGALYDLRERLQERLRGRLRAGEVSPVGMRRFIRAFRQHLDATLWEASNRARGRVPDTEIYIRMRPLTGGLSIVTELVELLEGTYLPVEVREDPVVARLTEASHNIVCWANDILSLDKELGCGEVNNLVLVLRESDGLTLQHAVDRAAEMHDAEVRVFAGLQRTLPSFGPAVDENLNRYTSTLRARIRGVLDWSRESGRYRGTVEEVPGSPARGSTTVVGRR